AGGWGWPGPARGGEGPGRPTTEDDHVTETSPLPQQLCDAYLFDLDGTIYLGEELLPGARDVVVGLRERGIPVRFLSNNPTKSPVEYASKLTRLGIPTPVEEVTNTVTATTRWLPATHPGATVFPIAEQPLIDAFADAGIAMSEEPEQIDIVVASYDRSFTYRKLQIAFDAIWQHQRAILVATNPDRYCPFPGGRGEPDCAAIVAAIEASTGATCAQTIGKPDPAIALLALQGLDVDPSRCMMVGDRLMTDIALGINAGMASALVLTGDSGVADVEAADPGERPTYIIDSVDQLILEGIATGRSIAP
uniref:HAD-IIA family hydrolase n=1 Tax=Pseudactinotalea sp. TaxID=1926260 RepID=UPI003B3A484C